MIAVMSIYNFTSMYKKTTKKTTKKQKVQYMICVYNVYSEQLNLLC